jgi:hypothetical protein
MAKAKPKIGDGFIALSHILTPPGSIRISSPQSSHEFARMLYGSFRFADKLFIKRINIVLPEDGVMKSAISDRTLKASGKNSNYKF